MLAIVKKSAGFQLDTEPPEPQPLTKAHLSAASSGPPLKLKGLRNVKNVNRLVDEASLPFEPEGLTIIYGRNGSGKSGFVRILRTACRTRTENPEKLKVLTNVYGSDSTPQEAEIIVDQGSGDFTIPWKPEHPASDALLHVSVFDSSAAQIYVDSGSQIQFLPFGLALPHKLNETCIALKERLETERQTITEQISLTNVDFEKDRPTKAQTFYEKLNSETTDSEIATATTFSNKDESRLTELSRLLTTIPASAADLNTLRTWITNLVGTCKISSEELSGEKLKGLKELRKKANESKTAASLKATDLFSNEPLPGVGSETWRQLWLAARNYSVAEAYPEREFPVVSSSEKIESCVLCHQPLGPEASERLKRFQEFVSGTLSEAAELAEKKVAQAEETLPDITIFSSENWDSQLEQIRIRDENLADSLMKFKDSAEKRHSLAVKLLRGDAAKIDLEAEKITPLTSELSSLSEKLSAEQKEILHAGDEEYKIKLENELYELTDRKLLASNRDRLKKRRDLLKQDKLYRFALAEVQTKGITQKANELVDSHLTTLVINSFNSELSNLEIDHLKIELSRKSDRTKASFQTEPGTKLAKATSDILSEGEQRALALSAFLTEVGVTEGAGPIVIDDPVSSLDRDRGLLVATRIAEEAEERQVIVFTHDYVFFNDLCREADERGVNVKTVGLFADAASTGKVDPAGVPWTGLSVKKRLGLIKNDFASVKKLHSSSPSDYELKIKNLYGRLRDTYERLVEEYIFCDVIRRGVDRVETQKLRMVHLSDDLAVRFHKGMTRSNTYSHDNPKAETVLVPKPADFEKDLDYIEDLIDGLKSESAAAEGKRPSMKPKK